MPLAVALTSIVASNRNAWPVEFHIVYDGMSEATRANLTHALPNGSASCHWLALDRLDAGWLRNLPPLNGASRMTYARFLIPQIFPEDTPRVLYLDVDIVVMDALAPLWDTPLNGAILGAVIDGGVDPLLKRGLLTERRVARVRDYFNAGMLLIDLPRWRSERVSERARAYLERNPDTFYHDQDALNATCEGRWHPLPRRWNFQPQPDQRIDSLAAADRPAVVHFVSTPKPWNPRSLSVNSHLHDRFRQRTPYARTWRERTQDALVAAWTWAKRGLKRRVLGPVLYEQIRSLGRRSLTTGARGASPSRVG